MLEVCLGWMRCECERRAGVRRRKERERRELGREGRRGRGLLPPAPPAPPDLVKASRRSTSGLRPFRQTRVLQGSSTASSAARDARSHAVGPHPGEAASSPTNPRRCSQPEERLARGPQHDPTRWIKLVQLQPGGADAAASSECSKSTAATVSKSEREEGEPRVVRQRGPARSPATAKGARERAKQLLYNASFERLSRGRTKARVSELTREAIRAGEVKRSDGSLLPSSRAQPLPLLSRSGRLASSTSSGRRSVGCHLGRSDCARRRSRSGADDERQLPQLVLPRQEASRTAALRELQRSEACALFARPVRSPPSLERAGDATIASLVLRERRARAAPSQLLSCVLSRLVPTA